MDKCEQILDAVYKRKYMDDVIIDDELKDYFTAYELEMLAKFHYIQAIINFRLIINSEYYEGDLNELSLIDLKTIARNYATWFEFKKDLKPTIGKIPKL